MSSPRFKLELRVKGYLLGFQLELLCQNKIDFWSDLNFANAKFVGPRGYNSHLLEIDGRPCVEYNQLQD